MTQMADMIKIFFIATIYSVTSSIVKHTTRRTNRINTVQTAPNCIKLTQAANTIAIKANIDKIFFIIGRFIELFISHFYTLKIAQIIITTKHFTYLFH